MRLRMLWRVGVEEDEGARAGRCGEERGDGDGGGEAIRGGEKMAGHGGRSRLCGCMTAVTCPRSEATWRGVISLPTP